MNLVNGSLNIVVKGNIVRQPSLTKGGMCFLSVAREHVLDGKPVTSFISIKVWGEQAKKCVERLSKGDRVDMEVTVMENTAPETRTAEQIAEFPRDAYEYRLVSIALVFKKNPAPATESREELLAQIEALNAQIALKSTATQAAPRKSRKKA